MTSKIIIVIAGFICGLAIGWLVNGWRLSADSTAEKLSAVRANADHFRDATKMINEAATEHVSKTYKLEEKIKELKKELANAKKNSPLLADCKPDADRLRVLKDAVRAANTTAGQQSGS
jgi:uncharacterized coiled-coil DUF342 family protein